MIYIFRTILFLCCLQACYLIAPFLGVGGFVLLGIFVLSFYFGRVYNSLTAGVFYSFQKPKIDVSDTDSAEMEKVWFKILDYEISNIGIFLEIFSVIFGNDLIAHLIGCYASVKFNRFLNFEKDLKEATKEKENE